MVNTNPDGKQPIEAACDARSALARTRAVATLGIVTRNSSPAVFVDHETGEIHTVGRNKDGSYRPVLTPEQSRAKRWARKSVANRLLPESRVSKCMNWRRPNAGYGLADIDVCKGTHGKAFYQGLMACGDIWGCACCAGKVSERRRIELQAAIASATALGWATHFVTLTVPHGVGDDLDELLGALSGSLKRLSTGKYSIKGQLANRFPGCIQHGYIRATEVTHGEHGWHPHFHILVFTSPDLSPADLRSVYSPAWQRACLLSGLPKPHDVHGVTVQDGTKAAQYASKWGLEDEMTKAHTKQARGKGVTPFGLLDAVLDGTDPVYTKPRSSALFIQFTKSFKGRRQLFWSVGLRAKLDLAPELSDQELVDLPDDDRASLLATLDDDDWRAVRRFRQEAHILTVAESNPSLLRQVVQSLRDAMPVRDPLAEPVPAAPQPVVLPLDDATRDRLVLGWVNYRNSYLKGFSHGKATSKETSGVLLLPPENDSGSGGLDRLLAGPRLLASPAGSPQLGFTFDCAYALRRG
ncbi:Replication protein [compost metagenome]|jgi:hypothetical protein